MTNAACHCCPPFGSTGPCLAKTRPAPTWRDELATIVTKFWRAHRADLVLDAAAVLAGREGVTFEDRVYVDNALAALEWNAAKCPECHGTGGDENDQTCEECDGDTYARTKDRKVYAVALLKCNGRSLGVVCPLCWRDADIEKHAECECGAHWREDLTAPLAASLVAAE